MENKLQPKLRFKEFIGNWEEKKLGEVLTERKVKQKISEEAPLLAFASGQGVIDRSERKTNNRDFLTKDSTQKKYLLTKYDDIVYNPSNLKYGAIDRNKHGQGVISPIYVTFETNEIPCFIELIVKMENFKRRALQYEEGTVTKRQSVKPESLLCLSVTKPRLNEQEKIASFFSTMDSKIEKLEKKKELLKEYKKGVMQGIFSQKIRFKDDNGNPYPQWEEKELGEIAKFSKGKNISKADISEKGLECIRYGELYTKYTETINEVISKTELPSEALVLSDAGDIVIPASGETAIDLATASCILREGIGIGGDINIIRTNENGVFLAYYMNSAKKHNIASLAQGSSVIHIYNSQLQLLKLSLPCLEEQEKIADFLSGIDRKIDLVEKEVESNKEFKKGLLQQMFV